MAVKVLIGLLLYVTALHAVAIDGERQALLSYSEIYLDKSAGMGLKEAAAQLFKPVDIDYLRLGYTHEAVWLRFQLENSSERPKVRELELDNCMLDTVTLFRPDGSSETTGVLHKDHIDGSRLHPYFTIVMPPHSNRTYYLRSQSDSCANYFRLTLLTPEAAWFKEMRYQLALALFFGALLALIVYNFFIWIFTRERVYIYYVLYLLSWMMTHISFSCMGQHLFKSIPWFITVDAFLGLYYNAVNIVLAFLFFKTFFQTPEKYPKINRILNGGILYFFALSLLSVTWRYLIEILDLSLLVSSFVLGGLLVYWLYKEFEQTKYLFAGWLLAVAGFVSLALDQLGIPNPIDRWRYFFEFAIAAEALLFSVALAARLNRQKALEQALSTQKKLQHELLHRVKNNMQTILSMYRIKLADATMENLQTKMDEVERTVQSMGRIHEMLYTQKEIDEVEAASYLGFLVKQLRRSAPPGVSVLLDTDVRLGTDRAVYCAVIINELVTNALKYAFNGGGGEVHIRLHREKDSYTLQVSDNGSGMGMHSVEGFGLGLVRAFVEDELHGQLESRTDGGCIFEIRFKV